MWHTTELIIIGFLCSVFIQTSLIETLFSDIDECTSSPCSNGGVCSNSPGTYACICSDPGYTGLTCSDGRLAI